uniref:Chromosome 1 open reading frame 216 n=1 Tax=Chelydra serpentina TaxID=8475 RepID=A0A8C3T865_CHESE
MFAVCQPDVPLNAPFHEGKRDPTLGTFFAERELRQDKNFNFVEEGYDSNENWRLKSDELGLSEEDVHSPPKGAELSGAEKEKAATEDTAKEGGKLAGSPLEDNGYASSSLSIDSPDSSTGNAWEAPAAATKDPRKQPAPQVPDADPENSSDSDAVFPVLAEAFQNLQDQMRFKEREKEKHHIHLVMYRRLALLRWIRGLQQKVVEQQNRLQESFDTVLDNRKELLRYIQQGMVCPKAPAHAGL